MFAVGFIAVAMGLWLIDSAIKNRRPIKTLTAIIQNPSRYRQMIKAGEGTLTDLTYDDEGYLTGKGGTREWGDAGKWDPNDVGKSSKVAYVSGGSGGGSVIAPTVTDPMTLPDKKAPYGYYKSGGKYIPRTSAMAKLAKKNGRSSGGGSGKASGVINYARAQIGKPYVWGGVGPYGYDCSGLIYKAYESVGIKIPRATSGQIGGGRKVSKNDIQPGDLIFPYPGHVFLAIGGGRAIEAPRTGLKVREIKIYGNYYAIRRYL